MDNDYNFCDNAPANYSFCFKTDCATAGNQPVHRQPAACQCGGRKLLPVLPESRESMCGLRLPMGYGTDSCRKSKERAF